MVLVPGGKFSMGSDDRFAYPEDGEGPVKEVEVTEFSIDACVVTNDVFSAFVEETRYVTEAERFGWSFVFAGLLPDDFPPTQAVARAPGGAGSSWRTGGTRRDRRARSRDGEIIPSSTSPGTTRRRTARGRESGCRPRRSGSGRPAAG
jgi:formylglycine-generating enzyme required for sulfatase activity